MSAKQWLVAVGRYIFSLLVFFILAVIVIGTISYPFYYYVSNIRQKAPVQSRIIFNGKIIADQKLELVSFADSCAWEHVRNWDNNSIMTYHYHNGIEFIAVSVNTKNPGRFLIAKWAMRPPFGKLIPYKVSFNEKNGIIRFEAQNRSWSFLSITLGLTIAIIIVFIIIFGALFMNCIEVLIFIVGACMIVFNPSLAWTISPFSMKEPI